MAKSKVTRKKKTTKRRPTKIKKKRATKKSAAGKKMKMVNVPSTMIRDLGKTLKALQKSFIYGIELQKTWNKYMK